MNEEQVKELMRSSKTEQEWNNNCDVVKKSCNGYPSFWFTAIIASGLCGEVSKKFGKDDKIHIKTIDLTD